MCGCEGHCGHHPGVRDQPSTGAVSLSYQPTRSKQHLPEGVPSRFSEFDVKSFATILRNRTEYAKSARLGLTALETEPSGQAAAEIHTLAKEVSSLLEKTHA